MIKSAIKWFKRKLLAQMMAGTNVYCPICEKNFSRFLPYGATKRENAQCPNCKSLERHRLLWIFLKERNLFATHTKLLHVSPESVFFKRFASDPSIDYCPIDKFDPGYRYPKGTQNVDITQAPYPDNSFDAILCIHVLEHIPDDRKAMRELFRVLKPGGWAIILVPMDKKLAKTYEDFSLSSPEERMRAFGQEDHVRLYGIDYAARLTEAGFHVEINDVYERLSDADRLRLALLPGEDIYLCGKN